MGRISAALSIIAVVLLASASLQGCSPAAVSAPQEQNVPEAKQACVKPNIQAGSACCLDANDNGACDSVENVSRQIIREGQPAAFNNSLICKRSPIDGYVACIILWLQPITITNPTAKIMRISVGFSGWDPKLIRIPQLERKASLIESLDKQEVLGYIGNISAGCSLEGADQAGLCKRTVSSWPIALSVDVPKWPEGLVSTNGTILVRACTQVDSSNEINCQNTTYYLDIGLPKK